jgi:rhodanese-related sulfurtransferase
MTPTPVSAAEAKRMLDEGEPLTFVDARNPVAWKESRNKLPGAIRIPADEVDGHIDELPREGKVVTYCT